MKTLSLLVLGLLATVAIGHAQTITVTNLGLISVGDYPSLGITNYDDPDEDDGTNPPITFRPMGIPAPAAIAEAITPEIQALADGLQDDPLQIFNYVHDHIKYSLYFGSKKGAALTLLEKSGNDFDQCALLVALLRAAGYSNAGYQFGWMLLPYDSTDGTDRDLHHWFNLDMTNSNWSATSGFLDGFLRGGRGYPITAHNWGNNVYAFQRVWVTVTIGGTNYNLDAAFKVNERIPNLNLQAAMGFSSNALMTNVGGLDVGNYTTNFYTTNLNEAALSSTLTAYTTNLLNYIQSNCPNYSVAQVAGGQYIVPSTNTTLPQGLPFPTTNLNGTMPIISWDNQPTNMMSTMSITFLSTNYQWLMPQLEGRRLSLTTSSSGLAQLWLDDTNIASGNTGGGAGVFTVTIKAFHPGLVSSWNTTSNTFVPGAYVSSGSASYKAANASYAIMYTFSPDWGWLQARQKQLDAYLQSGLANTSRQVTTETLNIMGLNWMLQSGIVSDSLGAQAGATPFFYHRIGRMGQESGAGYYVDIYMQTTSTGSSFGDSNNNRANQWVDTWCYFASAMEHGLIEQLQATNLTGASSVKILELANTNHYAVYLVNSTNWPSIQTKLVNYTISDLTYLINAGYTLLLPQNGTIAIAGAGSWSGYGFMAHIVTPQGNGAQMLIGSGKFGGYVSSPTAIINPPFVDYSGYSQPTYFNSAPTFVPPPTGADPVNMADGTFQAQATDLSLGQTEPRGLVFSRYYNSSRRNSNLAGIAPGWLHNYYFNAANISSPQAGLGDTTPAQMAATIVATTVAMNVYNGLQPDPQNWLTTALIAKWGVDQLTAKSVSISLGQDTVQFIQQPDGSYTPPANCTMSLLKTNSVYWLKERQGRTFKFNALGWATNITDQYGQALNLTYNASNWVTKATDWKGHTLTYNYSTTAPIRLTNVVDSAGRKVSFGYGASNDLVSVTDPEGKISTFGYDTNHQITAVLDANTQVVASNIYNAYGRVTTQYTQGDTNKTWHVYWSGWKTVSQDPAGGQQVYLYDNNTRLIGQSDALGHLTQKIYDGQDHVVTTISPMNETNRFIFDGHHNLIQTIDPLGFSNQFVYDGQNNLVQANDALGHPTTYGYNAQFSVTGQTNGAGDWVNYTYNTDGTLHTSTDSGGTTTNNYDANGSLSSVVYPGGFGSESFVNNTMGDPTNHVDARGFVTSFQFNNRRQLTNAVAPTNITVKASFDAVGNAVSTTDARGNVTSNVWSATQHLLKTVLPATPQGVAVTTNGYDNRDLLVRSVDPLNHPVVYTNDLGGHTVALADPLQRATQINYDADGRTLATTNAAGEVTRQQWDARGKLIQQTDGAGHSTLSVYDAAGNQTILTNRNGNKWQFQFDGANRLTNTITPMGRSSSTVFNHQGLPVTLKDPASQTTSLYYDAKGRLTNRTDNVATTLYRYDANDNLTNVVENGLTNVWVYNAYNQVASYQDVYGNLIQYKHDVNGNVTNLVYPGGRNVYYAYDSLNQMTNVTDWAGRKTSITYDLAGHVTAITRPNGTYRTINYDSAGQTTNILEETAIGFPIALFKLNWDSAARAQWEFAAPLPHTNTPPTRTMTYNADNELASVNFNSVTMDADGNLISGPLTNDTFAAYTFDARNRLLNVGGVTNAYDSVGNRIGQIYGTNSTVFVVNPNASLPQVLMRIKNGVTNYYVYGVGLMYQVTETATTTNTRSYHYDYRGSTVALTDDSGNVTDRVEYSAYGTTTWRAGNTDTPFLFDGEYGVMTDPNGLLDMQARYYNPYLCRFISSDPSGFNGGLNTYAFANGNPVSYVDPFGLGAVNDAVLAASWFNAPTPFQQQIQGVLAAFVDVATLGVANLASESFTRYDLVGNQVTPEAQNEASIYLAVALIPGVDLDATGARLATSAAEGFAEEASTVRYSMGSGNYSTGGSQQLLSDTAFGHPSLAGVKLTTSPIYDANLPYFGEFSASGLNNFGVKIGPQAFVNETELVGTIVHEETHLRFFQRLNAGGARTSQIDASGGEEAYVRSVEARFLRMKGHISQ